ncbi:hypothetical protein IW262DRAFT_1477172 [Armillaria fumosa]|nr:hypothetical protein IW262DRAFT_1477172 [Armillaria fumosa]
MSISVDSHKNSSVSDASLRHAFIALHIVGGQVGLPIILLTWAFSKSVVRHPTLVNLWIAFIVYSISYCILLYSGQGDTAPASPSNICLVQSAMIYGAPPMSAVAGLLVVCQIWQTFQEPSFSTTPTRWPNSVKIFLVLPYLVFLIFAFTAGILGMLHPERIYNLNGLYCSLHSANFSRYVVPTFCVTVISMMVILEVTLVVRYYRMWAHTSRVFPLASRRTSPSLLLRVLLFDVYSVVVFSVAVFFLSDFQTHWPYMIQASVPLTAVAVFGSQASTVSAYRRSLRKGYVHWDMDELDKVPDESHDGKANSDSPANLNEFYTKGVRERTGEGVTNIPFDEGFVQRVRNYLRMNTSKSDMWRERTCFSDMTVVVVGGSKASDQKMMWRNEVYFLTHSLLASTLRTRIVDLAGSVVRVHAPRHHGIGWRFAHSDADNSAYKQAHDEFAKDQIEGFARALKNSRNKRDDILAYYPNVASQVRWSLSNNPKPTVTKASATYIEHLHTVVETLAMSGQGSDLKYIEQILKDLPIVFLLDPSPEIHTIIIRGLVKNGNMSSALLWLKTMSTKPGQLQPTLGQYHLLLESCITSTSPKVSLKFMKSVVKAMRDTDCQPTHDTYAILIRYLWSKPNVVLPPTIFETLIQDMSEDYLPLNQRIADLLYEPYADRGLMKLADQLLQTYRKSVPTTLITADQIRDARWLDSLSRESYRIGINGAVTLFKELQKDGAVGTVDVLKALLRGSTTTEDLMKAQEATGVQATAVHWSMLTSKNARRSRLPHALSIYKDSREAGITPTLSVSGPLIRAFCLVGTEDSLDEAFSLYQDLTAANEPGSSTTQNIGPDVAIYQSMLSGLSLIPDPTKALDIADILLADMSARDIPLNGMGHDVISIRIRNSSDEAKAYEIYQDLKHTVQGLGFVKVIDALCALSHRGRLHVPSLEKVFTIIGDMKRSGQSINLSIYTMLLGHFNEIAIRIDEQSTSSEFADKYCDTVRRIHDLLVLESFSPEAPLWNLLMDTYRRVDRHHDVYRVWEQIFLSGKYDHESVNIILDSCGLSQDLSAARNVYTRLNEGGYTFTKENWDTWVKCLCCTNQVNEAVKTVCLEMSRRGVQPDETTVRKIVAWQKR